MAASAFLSAGFFCFQVTLITVERIKPMTGAERSRKFLEGHRMPEDMHKIANVKKVHILA